MKQLNRIQSIIMLVGGMMMVVSSCLIMMATLMSDVAWTVLAMKIVPWVFLVGAIAYVVMQRMQTYNGTNMTIRRLMSIQLLSCVCFVVAGLLIVENYYHFVQPFVVSDINSYFTYLQVVHNNWVVALLIGAVLQMYTVHRIGSELNKDS